MDIKPPPGFGLEADKTKAEKKRIKKQKYRQRQKLKKTQDRVEGKEKAVTSSETTEKMKKIISVLKSQRGGTTRKELSETKSQCSGGPLSLMDKLGINDEKTRSGILKLIALGKHNPSLMKEKLASLLS